RVLIVDDHQEIRTVLRANLETLGLDLDLVDVPSGEEAIVEVVGTGIDLLIADVGLPGLSGIELIRKLKTTYKEMQVIVITGMEDDDIHQEIADLDPEAFFLKPLKMPEFLNAVRKTMGLDPVEEDPEELIKLTKKALSPDVTSRIADLRGELGAISIMVIEASGVIGAETGIVPDTVYETHVMPLLLNTFKTTNKISYYLGNESPESVWYFSGEKYDLFWSHINTSYGMIIITNPVTQNNDLTWVLTTVDLAIQEVTEIIEGVVEKHEPAAKTTKTPSEKKTEEKSTKKTPSKAAKADLPKETPKGSNGSAKKSTLKKSQEKKEESEIISEGENDVHDFWKAATLEEEITRIDSPDSLSFDQAQKLGFIPGGDAL
ncbi:MAG: response regulator, partial [Anaerolineales bacterium]|nr:response regulator [Anaerolineales bacterium]